MAEQNQLENPPDRVVTLQDIMEDMGVDPSGSLVNFTNKSSSKIQNEMNEKKVSDRVAFPQCFKTRFTTVKPEATTSTHQRASRSSERGNNPSAVDRTLELMRRETSLITRAVRLIRGDFVLFTVNMYLSMEKQKQAHSQIYVTMIRDLLTIFTGIECNFEQWEHNLRLLCATYGFDENSAKLLLTLRLKGEALAWFQCNIQLLEKNLNEILQEMRMRYGRINDPSIIQYYERLPPHTNTRFLDDYVDRMIKEMAEPSFQWNN